MVPPVMNRIPLGDIATPVTGVIVFVALAAFIVVTFVLDYHVRNYITDAMRPTVAFARIMYLGVSFITVVMIVLLTLSLFS